MCTDLPTTLSTAPPCVGRPARRLCAGAASPRHPAIALRGLTGLAFLIALGLPGSPARAAELVVDVLGVADAQGSLGCALFNRDAAAAFPLSLEAATRQRSPARAGAMQCVFRDLPAGSYAVSAAHDLNDNGKTDRNLVGMPTEPWAVSNNVRPTLRAPRFAEAAITLEAGDTLRIELRLQR